METNLLPQSEKSFLRAEKLFRVIIVAVIIGLLGLGTVAGFLFGMRLLVQIHEESVKKQLTVLQTAIQESASGQINQKISDLNKTTTFLDKNFAQQSMWSPMLLKFLNTVPTGININELVGNSLDLELRIKGIATTRDNLLEFQETLKNEPLFTEVNAPLSNIVTKEDVPFEIVATINPNELHPYTNDAN